MHVKILPRQEPAFLEFLLGGLTAEERERLEELAFSDDDTSEQLEATADDLIHAYLAGALSATNRLRFETHFLASPRRRERLEFLRQLVAAAGRVAGREPSHRPRWWTRPALAAVATGGILLGLLSQLGGPGGQEAGVPSRAHPAALEATPFAAASSKPQSDRRPLRTGVSVVRPARGRQTPTTLDLRDQPKAVRFEIAVEEQAFSFDVVIKDAEGVQVWSAEEIPPPDGGQPLVVTVPASAFSRAGDLYALQLQPEALRHDGPSPANLEYALRVIRR